MKPRTIELSRQTNETDIRLRLNFDGSSGITDVVTGSGLTKALTTPLPAMLVGTLVDMRWGPTS